MVDGQWRCRHSFVALLAINIYTSPHLHVMAEYVLITILDQPAAFGALGSSNARTNGRDDADKRKQRSSRLLSQQS
jgi:hypothetical protein